LTSMSFNFAVGLIAALDAFVVAAVACVCLIPFLIEKPKSIGIVGATLPDLAPTIEAVAPALEAASG